MRNQLPPEFRQSHDFCFFLHAQLVSIIKDGEEAKIFFNQITLTNEKEAREFGALSGEELLDWLRANGREADADLFLYKQITAGLLSDFLHFVYEGLKCSEKGKLTVAFSLFRKPFKDNLHYLEWLLADSKDFLARFESGGKGRFADPNIPKRDKITALIKAASELTRQGEWYNSDSLYKLRYDKKAFGMEGYWQRALHLVTNFKPLATTEGNFNFVFSNDEDIYSQWESIYSILPVLLFHTLQVVEAIIGNFAKIEEDIFINNQFRTDIGMALWLIDTAWEDEWESLWRALVEHYDGLELICQKCETLVPLNEKNLRLIYEESAIMCPECDTTWPLVSEN